MIEELFPCCTCKRKELRRCISCETDIFSTCGCIINKKAKQLELETDLFYPNVILYLCEECVNNIVKNCKLEKWKK